MKKLFYLLPVFILLFIVSGCKKEQNYTSGNTATVNVINGIVNKTTLIKMNGKINNSGMDASGGSQSRLYFGSNLFYFNEAKSTDFTVLDNADSSVLVTKNIDFKKGGIYTMLLTGIAPNADAVLIDDSNIPQIDPSKLPSDADSIVYVRFINLSPDVQPIDIHMQGAASDEITGLAFKQASSFKAYPGKVTTHAGTLGYSSIIFQFKQNGTVLKSYTLFVYTPFDRFKNIALVLTGMKNPNSGQPGLSVVKMNYFQ
jgi:hypothetical protein